MTNVSIRPTQRRRIESIGKTWQSVVEESTNLRTDTIKSAYRLKLELGAEVLVVHDFVDEDDDVDGDFTVAAAILPRLQRLPKIVLNLRSSYSIPPKVHGERSCENPRK